MTREAECKAARRGWLVTLVVCLLVFVDQAVKIYIKTHFELHESVRVANWFYIFFTENNGMAFGWEFFDKIFLTLFRIVASGLLVWYLVYLCRQPKGVIPTGYLVCVAMILAGALGNIFDCLFYGLVFDHSYGQVAQLFPAGGGYGKFGYGKVVDMLYFPLIDTDLPANFPIWGGQHFIFFRPIFNIADSCITVGILVMLIFYHKTLSSETSKAEKRPAKTKKE